MSDLFGGGSSQPNIVIPPQKTPKAFQTIIPQKSYKDLAESIGRTEDEIIRLEGNRQDMVGTAQELGAKQRGIEMQEAASYASSYLQPPVLIQALEELLENLLLRQMKKEPLIL